MGYDPFLPISEAHINVLCVPAAKFSRDEFEQCVAALQACSQVSLKTVRRVAQAGEGGPKFTEGTVLLNVSAEYEKDIHLDVYPLVPNRVPQIVLGLVSGEEGLDDITGRQSQIEEIAHEFQRRSIKYDHSIVNSVVVFGGRPPLVTDQCLWVDTDGQGPDLTEVLARLIWLLHRRLPSILKEFQNTTIEPQQLSSQNRRYSIASVVNGSSLIDGARGSPRRTDSPSVATPVRGGPTQADEAAGRHSVVRGLLTLQAGLWPDALRHLSEGGAEAREAGDHIWHAKALEGLVACMLLFAWAHIDYNIPQICYPTNERSDNAMHSRSMAALIAANRPASSGLFSATSVSSEQNLTELIPHLTGSIIGLYEIAVSRMDSIAPFSLVCEARIRWANLFIAIKGHGSILRDATLQQVVEGTKPIELARYKHSAAPALTLPSSLLSRMLIESALEAQSKLPIQQAATIIIAVASSLSVLGVERKQAFYLKDFLQRLGPALAEARRLGAAEFGLHPAAGIPPNQASATGRSSTSVHGIRLLLNRILEIYGLSVTGASRNNTELGPARSLSEALQFWHTLHSSGDLYMKLEVLSLCNDVSEAIPDPEDNLYFTSKLLQAARKVITLPSDVSDASPIIALGDQSRLLQAIKKAIGIAGKFGLTGIRANYWDKFLVRDINLLEDLDSTRLIPHSAQDLSLAASGDEVVKKDPFIFNPFAKTKASSGISVVTVGAIARFGVVLQNTLDVDVEIDDIHLVTEGSRFEPLHHSIILGPLCSQVFLLTGVPRATGSLTITGCRATVKGCYQETYLILPEEYKFSTSVKEKMQLRSLSTPATQVPTAKILTMSIIEPLPTLSVVDMSLTQGSLMLLEGQRAEVELTVRNDSDIVIDLLLLTFEDSVKRQLEEALHKKDLSPADMYEIQHQITTNPAIRWNNETSELRILPHQVTRFVLEVYGKPGLTDINILMDYAHLGKPRAEVKDKFYTRQLSYSLSTTVNGSADIARCLILPLHSSLPWHYSALSNGKVDEDKTFSECISKSDACKHSILLLDVRNVWPQPLEIRVDVHQPNDQAHVTVDSDAYVCSASEVLQPGQMSRMLLLVPKLLVTNPFAPIPNLDRKRQFVVSASGLTLEAESMSRELFWYRERLLACLQAQWTEQGTKRTGELDMRKSIRLSPRMIDALKVDHVEVSFSLKPASPKQDDLSQSNTVIQTGGSCFRMPKNAFGTLVTTVHNRSDSPVKLLLRLQPSIRHQPHNVALDLSRRFAWSGALQRALHPELGAGEARSVELGVIALSAGEYEINGTVEELRSRITRSPAPMLEPGTSPGRRIWHARQPCIIEATNEAVDP